MPETLRSSEEENDADIIDMEQNPETGEWESKNPKQDILERPGLVDKNKMEDKIREIKERMQKREEASESGSVLDVPEKGKNRNNEGTAAGLAGEARAEKKENQETKEKSPRELAEEDFRKRFNEEYKKGNIESAIERWMGSEKYMEHVRMRCQNELREEARGQMTEQERKSFNETGQFETEGVFGKIGQMLGIGGSKIDARDVEGLLSSGLTLEEIRNIKSIPIDMRAVSKLLAVSFREGPVRVGDKKDLFVADIRDFFGNWLLPNQKKPISSKMFDRIINEGIENKIREIVIRDAEKEWERKKQDWLDWRVKELEVEEKLKQEKQKEKKTKKKK